MNKNILLLGGVLLAIALFPLPYGYYQLLRVAICGISAWVLYVRKGQSVNPITYCLWAVAIIYNPFVSIHLTRELWLIINMATILLFLHIRANFGSIVVGSAKIKQ